MTHSATRDRLGQEADGDRKLIRHIAVCVDRSTTGESVMPHAVAIAGAFGAELTVLHVLEPPRAGVRTVPTDPLDWEVQRTEAKRHLDALRSDHLMIDLSVGAEAPSIGTEVLEGRPAQVIRDWVTSHDVDLTVLASHGASGLTEWSLASTARKLVEGIAGSVFLVPARSDPGPPAFAGGYNRVLVLLDGSTRAESALVVASQVARAENAELLLLHVVPKPEPACPCPLDEQEHDLDQRLIERNVRAANFYLSGIARRIAGDGIGVRTHVSVDSDDVRAEIQGRIIADGVDLVIFSGHGHAGRSQHAVGSVAAFLVEHATVPLLVVRDASQRIPATHADARSRSGIRLPHGTDG